jgi:phage terminase large subunit-like protein
MTPRGRRKKEAGLSVDEIGSLLKEGLSQAVTRPTIHGYKPHPKQIKFHSSTKKGRLYIGGNRAGKTVGGTVEDIWRMRGQHPYQKVPPPPTRGRICTISYTEGIEKIIIPELSRWLPPSDLINGSWEDSYSKSLRTLTLANGSTCELMSYDQAILKFAGTSRHWTHFDEEPPKDIYTECRMRLIDTGGCWYMTMTPVEGMTWVYDDVYIPGLTGDSNVTVIVVDSAENPHISEAELEEVVADLDENEKKARKQGQFVALGGLAFPKFNIDLHVIESFEEWDISRKTKILGWSQYQSMDHGFNAPTAWLWHAVSPSGSIVTFDELYDREKIIPFYAAEILKRNNLEYRRTPDIYVGDPAIRQRQAVTGTSIQTEYTGFGIPIVPGNNEVLIGVEKMNRNFEMGKWAVTENCVNFIRELQRARWKIYETAKQRQDNPPREELHRKHSHSPDAARYFISLLPDLRLPQQNTSEVQRIEQLNQELGTQLGAVKISAARQEGLTMDDYLNSMLKQSTDWHRQQSASVDEYMGGEW